MRKWAGNRAVDASALSGVASRGANGEPILSKIPSGQSLPKDRATQAIQNPNVLPAPKLKTAAIPKPTSKTSFAEFIAKKCQRCHQGGQPEALPDGRIKKGTKTLTIAQAIAATKRVPAMRTGVSDEVRAQLQAFASP